MARGGSDMKGSEMVSYRVVGLCHVKTHLEGIEVILRRQVVIKI